MTSELAPVLHDLAPAGVLRAAINLANPVLARAHPATGELLGLAVAMARELARRLGIPLELVVFHGAGTVVDAVGTGAWDVAFLAIDPARASRVAFTEPYLLIEGAYVVPGDSPLWKAADVDRPGVRVAVGAGSAYDLHLTRVLQHATLVRAPSAGVVDRFLSDGLEVLAGVRPALVELTVHRRTLRLLDGSFMTIRQAMCLGKRRAAGHRYLHDFVQEMKRSGFISRALAGAAGAAGAG